MSDPDVSRTIRAIREGRLAVLATDTVYGLVADPDREEAVTGLRRVKGKPPGRPFALVAADVEVLLAALPEIGRSRRALVRALLPAPLTLVVANPGRRYSWLAGSRPATIGVRVPVLPPRARAVVAEVGAVAATSANLHGGPDPSSPEELVAEVRRSVAVVLDDGDVPGIPSTVVDLTAREPAILREGAVPAHELRQRLAVLG